ncbi:MAG: REP-associated tyrosine transposase [Candidatus Sumerlaeota bacterium]|nr:REP-associated tyrosine transposase [Candidatus Sumerlaeota bacterium]
MAREARIIVPGCPHHILQKSAEGETIFSDRTDRQLYLNLLEQNAADLEVEVLAYALLKDAVHLVLVPKKQESLSLALRRTHSAFSRALNARRGTAGTVWQSRFSSCPVEKSLTASVVKYVERQPVRTRAARKPESYAWSSASVRTGKKSSLLLSTAWMDAAAKRRWVRELAKPQPEEEIAAIEAATRGGYALGGKAFIKRLEKKLGRSVVPRRVGRPVRS